MLETPSAASNSSLARWTSTAAAGDRHRRAPHEAPLLPALLDAGAVRRSGSAGRPSRGRPRKRPERLAADKGYSYPSVRAELRRRGIGAVIPTRSNQRRRSGFDRMAYAERNRVER